jgi:hypothetical protein
VNPALVQQVWERARNRCEYCQVPHPYYRLPFQIDHIIARQHAGPTSLENLALACFHCNRHKGPNIAGQDAESGEIVRLFHPRKDFWRDHFRFVGPELEGLTAIGRVTVQVLAINDSDLVAVRHALIQERVFHPDD